MALIIPHHPQSLSLHVRQLWNGNVCPDERVWADVTLASQSDGLAVHAEAPVLHDQLIPQDTPMGTRVEGLWNFDVVELFLVGPGHRYFELELGAGGHFLALSFDCIRHRSDDHLSWIPLIQYHKTPEKTWVAHLVIPWSMIPENVRALNVFVYAAGQYLAMSQLPGSSPDFHQPDHFPSARIF